MLDNDKPCPVFGARISASFRRSDARVTGLVAGLRLHRQALVMRSLALAATIASAVVPAGVDAQELGHFYAEVVDRSGAPVLDLTALDFSIVKDGVELEVVSVTLDLSDGPVPMKIALLVDNSRLFNALNPLRAGLRAFFDSLPSLHEVSLFTIGGHIHRRTGFTADRNVLKDAADLIFPALNAGLDDDLGVVLLDGVRETWERRFVGDEPFPVFLLVLAEGFEGSGYYSRRQIDNLVAELRHGGVTIHTVLFGPIRSGRAGTSQLALYLTSMLGGAYETVILPSGLPRVLERLASRMSEHHARLSKRHRVVYRLSDPPEGPFSVTVRRAGVNLQLFAHRAMVR